MGISINNQHVHLLRANTRSISDQINSVTAGEIKALRLLQFKRSGRLDLKAVLPLDYCLQEISQPQFYRKTVADTHFEGGICHGFLLFSRMMSAEFLQNIGVLLCKSKLLHEGLWLRIVAAEVAVDYSLINCAAHLEDVLTE